MTDIAQLGLSIDSRQVTTATKALDGLTAAAKPAAVAAETVGKSTTAAGKGAADLTKSVTGASKAVDSLTTAVTPAVKATEDLTKATTGVATGTIAVTKAVTPAVKATETLVVSTKSAAVNLNNTGKGAAALAAAVTPAAQATNAMAAATDTAAHAHKGLSTQAMAAGHAVRSMGEMIAMGMPPTTILASQINHLSYAASGPGGLSGAFKEIGGAFAGLLTPVRLLGLGLAGVAVGGAIAANSLANSLKSLDDVAKSAGTSLGALKGLQDAASFKGISNDEFQKVMSKFADDVYRAKNGMGQLGEFLQANGQSAKSFDDAIAKVAEHIKNAKDDQERQQLLQRAGLASTMDWVRLWSQGGDAIKAALKSGEDFNGVAGNMVKRAREFDDAWNTATTNAANRFKGWLLSLDDLTFGAIDKFKQLAQNTYGSGAAPKRIEITGGTTSSATKAPVDPAVLQHDIAMQQQRLGLLGQVATVNEQIRSSELAISAARTQPGNRITDADVTRIQKYAAESALGVTAIKAQTDAARVEAATVGMSVGAATEYATVQNRINEERRKGNELLPDQLAKIQKEATALGQAATQADLLRSAYEGLVRGPLQTFTSAIAGGASAWDAFKKAGQSALNSIASKLADIAAQNLWASAFGGSGGGNLLGSLFGGTSGASAGPMTLGGANGPVPFFAGGTDSAPGGWSVVGENGPELMNVPKGAQILPNGMTPGGSVTVSGGPTTIVVQGNADEKTLNLMRQELAKRDAAFATNVVNTVKRAKQGRQLP